MILTVDEAALFLKVTPHTVRRLARNGAIPASVWLLGSGLVGLFKRRLIRVA